MGRGEKKSRNYTNIIKIRDIRHINQDWCIKIYKEGKILYTFDICEADKDIDIIFSKITVKVDHEKATVLWSGVTEVHDIRNSEDFKIRLVPHEIIKRVRCDTEMTEEIGNIWICTVVLKHRYYWKKINNGNKLIKK